MNCSPKSITMLKPLPHTKIKIDDPFWAPRITTNRNITLPAEYALCKKTGRIDAWKLNWKPGKPNKPHQFWDSDIAKWLEASAYRLATHPDRNLERKVDGIMDMLAKAQGKDGYLNSYFTAVEPHNRWKNLRPRRNACMDSPELIE